MGRKRLEERDRRAILCLTVSPEFRERLTDCAKRMGDIPLSRAVENLVMRAPHEFCLIARDTIRPLIKSWLEVSFYKHQSQSKLGASNTMEIRVEIDPKSEDIGLVMRALSGEIVDHIRFDKLLNIDGKMPEFLNGILKRYLSASEVGANKLNG